MARFFEWLKQLAKWWFIIAGVIATGFFILIFMAVSSLAKVTTITSTTPVDTVEDTPSAALLHMDLTGSVQRQRPDMDNVWAGFAGLQEKQTYLEDLRKGLRQAAKDDRVKGLWITTGAVMASATTINALRRMIEEFKTSSQKPVKMHVAMLSNSQLLLASAADEIIIPPLADIHVPGPEFQLTYFGEAINKVGLEFEVVKAGRYKSAMEPMTSNTPSAASLEMYEAMVAASTDVFTSAISKGRNKTPAEVQGWFSKAVFTPEEAIATGMADQMGYAVDHKATFAKSLEAETYSFRAYSRSSSAALAALASSESSSPIALINATGEITSFAGSSDEAITPERLIPRLKWALEDDDIKAVVLRVNSPGGSANASDIIWKEIRRLDSQKPVVVQMTDVAASGGYFLAVGGRKIVADPLTITGSIGVIYAAPYAPDFKENYGVSFHSVAVGEARSFSQPLTDAERQLLESSVRYTYSNFLDRVATGRGQDKAEIAPLAEGRVYTGAEAKALGLVDKLGGLAEAVAMAAELAEIKADPWPLRTYSKDSPFRQAFEMMSAMQGRVGTWLYRAAIEASPLGTVAGGAVPAGAAAPKIRLWKYWGNSRVALSYWPYHGQLH